MTFGEIFSTDEWKTLQEKGEKSATFQTQFSQSTKRNNSATVLKDEGIIYLQLAGVCTELFRIDLNTLSLQSWKKHGDYYYSTHLTELNDPTLPDSTQLEVLLPSDREEDPIDKLVREIEEEFRNLEEKNRNLEEENRNMLISMSEIQSSASWDGKSTYSQRSEVNAQFSSIEKLIREDQRLLSQSPRYLGMSPPGLYSTPGKMDDISTTAGSLKYQLREMKQLADDLHYDNEKLRSSLNQRNGNCEYLMNELRKKKQEINVLKREKSFCEKENKDLKHQLSRIDVEKTKLLSNVNSLQDTVAKKEQANAHLRSIIQRKQS